MDTAKLLESKLQQLKKTELVAKLEAALAKLPPIAFELPEYEKNVGGPRNLVLRRGKLRRPGWRDRAKAAEDRERRSLEEAKRRQQERLDRERKEKEAAAKAKRGK